MSPVREQPANAGRAWVYLGAIRHWWNRLPARLVTRRGLMELDADELRYLGVTQAEIGRLRMRRR